MRWSEGTDVLIKRSTGEWSEGQVITCRPGHVSVRCEDGGVKKDKHVPLNKVSLWIKEAPASKGSKNGKTKKEVAKPKPAKKKAPSKATKRKITFRFMKGTLDKMVELGYLTYDDEIHYQSDNNIAVVAKEDDGSHVIMDAKSGNKYITLNLWVVGEFQSKANNSGKVSFRMREGEKVPMLHVGLSMFREINGEDSSSDSSSSSTDSSDEQVVKRSKGKSKPTITKYHKCGICQKQCHIKTAVSCQVPSNLKSSSCCVRGHPECLGLKSKTQISQRHIFACHSCFVPYVSNNEQSSLLKYISSNIESFQAIGADTGFKSILPELLGKGTAQTYLIDPETNKPDNNNPAGISHYSFKASLLDHRKWLKNLLVASKLHKVKEVQPTRSVTPTQTKQIEPQKTQQEPTKSKIEIIDLDIDDVDEESINTDATKLANSFLLKKISSTQLSPLKIHVIRQFSGDSKSLYGKHDHFKPPPSREVDFFDSLSSGRDTIKWSLYLQGTPSDLQIVFWPGVQQYAKAISINDIEDFRGAFDDEDVYLHLTLKRNMSFLREVTRAMMKNRVPLLSPPNKKTDTQIALLSSSEVTKPVHITLMCHAALTGCDQTEEKIKAKAIMVVLQRLLNKEKTVNQKSMGEEVCWVRTPSVDLLGMSQKILSYAPASTMDKGYIILDDYNRLRANRFLNGDCINFYLRYLKQRRETAMIFPTHFMTKLIPIFTNTSSPPSSDKHSSSALDWCLRSEVFKIDKKQQQQNSIFSYSLLIVPINDPCRHWGLGAVLNLNKVKDGKAPTFIYLDSLLKPDKMRFTDLVPRFVFTAACEQFQGNTN